MVNVIVIVCTHGFTQYKFYTEWYDDEK